MYSAVGWVWKFLPQTSHSFSKVALHPWLVQRTSCPVPPPSASAGALAVSSQKAALYAGHRLELGLQLEIKLPSHNIKRWIYRYIRKRNRWGEKHRSELIYIQNIPLGNCRYCTISPFTLTFLTQVGAAQRWPEAVNSQGLLSSKGHKFSNETFFLSSKCQFVDSEAVCRKWVVQMKLPELKKNQI